MAGGACQLTLMVVGSILSPVRASGAGGPTNGEYRRQLQAACKDEWFRYIPWMRVNSWQYSVQHWLCSKWYRQMDGISAKNAWMNVGYIGTEYGPLKQHRLYTFTVADLTPATLWPSQLVITRKQSKICMINQVIKAYTSYQSFGKSGNRPPKQRLNISL